MSRRKIRTSVVTSNRPIPEPQEKNFATGLVFLIASFFNNTQSFDIERVDRDSAFAIRYRSNNYNPRRNRRRR